MLQSIREHTQGWIAGVIISLLILSFALWGIHSYIGGGEANPIVAKVNGIEITKQQLSVSYERLRRQLQIQFNSPQLPPQVESGLKERALQTLINFQVLKQAAYSQNFRISNAQIDNFIQHMPELQVDGRFSSARLQQLLQSGLFTAGDFLNLIEASLLIDQPRLGVVFTSFALPNEVENTISLVNQERDIQYAIIAADVLSANSIKISHEQVVAYYKAHQEEFKTPEQVSIEYVVLSLKDLSSSIKPTEQMLTNYYNENINSFSQPKQWNLETILIPVAANANTNEISAAQKKAQELSEKAASTKSFASLMNQYAATKADKRLQGWVSVEQLPAELQKAISSLSKAAPISQPVRMNTGFVIFKLNDVKEATAPSFAQAKDKVRETVVRQLAGEKFGEMREKLANVSYEHPESLNEAVKTLGLTIKTSDLFTKEQGNKDITADPKVRTAAFSNDVLNLQNNSDVISLSGDEVVVLRIKMHKPAAVIPLESVEKPITDRLTKLELDTRATRLVSEIQQKLTASNSNEIANQYHLVWKSLGFVSRHAEKVNGAILSAGFALPKPEGNTKVTYGAVKTPEGYAIVAVNGVRDIPLNTKNHDQSQVFAEQVQNSQGLMEYELYKDSKIKQAKISIE
jgi:peptidyl-prolyl cis-trans isomerase D